VKNLLLPFYIINIIYNRIYYSGWTMKGIILAGGKGTRLYPITKVLSKQILPVYDKPMIYYSLSVLMLAGIKDILIISSERDISFYEALLGNGVQYGVNIQYSIQKEPRGIAEAFIIGRSFIANSSVALILGDNVFYGDAFYKILGNIGELESQAIVFAYYVYDPSNYGIVEFNRQGEAISVEEKPVCPKSNYAIPGLYFYDSSVVDKAQQLKPSNRGELEITDINKMYLYNKQLKVLPLDSKTKWYDTGTCKSLHEASSFVRKTQRKGKAYVGCIEEVAFRKGYISEEQLLSLARSNIKSDYGRYLIGLTTKG